MTVDEIRELIDLAKETGVAVLDVQRGENRVRIRLSAGGRVHVVPAEAAFAAAAAPAAIPAVTAQTSPAELKEKGSDPNLVYVKSPIVGTFYEAPSPETPPFVRVGERIQPGKVLCIIESMKLMNEIEAEIAGVVEAKLVMNGQPVEYGEAMFAIRPV
ncbi:MAG TPA: acetyl-CoA carboxylase biotin carboxyl carrier protein [Bryobacteraceae bacterium]|nr:acetyl-CoA carboxylase biotin carboxyl carrier protein [Bryobacteraceae bacterium]